MAVLERVVFVTYCLTICPDIILNIGIDLKQLRHVAQISS